MRIWVLCVGMLLVWFSPAANAADKQQPVLAKVYGSVFVQHLGKFQRAKEGMLLEKGDEVRTSARSKVYIDFPDQSRIKLGVRSRFVVHDWDVAEPNVFKSSFSVLQGAFRYTASAIRGWVKRDTTVYTKTAVIGVRGTDFWGRVEQDETFLLLLEGVVSLAAKDGDSIMYDKAGYAVQIQTDISTPQALTMDKIAPLAAETEIE